MNPRWKPGFLVALILLTVALFVLAWVFPAFPGDEAALLRFQEFQTQELTTGAVAVSLLGSTPVVLGMVGVTSVGLFLLRRRADALMVGLSLVPMAAGNGLKALVGRPRPDYLLIGPPADSLSFPSGHALSEAIIGGLLISLVGEWVPFRPLQRALQAAILLLVLAGGASRVYLGLHWPSDVIGGYLFGIVMLVGLTRLRHYLLNML
jgi:undecaprenyl-diphosphatase